MHPNQLFLFIELTAPNYVILDLAYNWQSFCGHFFVDVDGSHFPSSDYRRRFLKRYLQEFNNAEQIKLSEEEFNCELEDLFHRVSLAAVGHLLKWCIFAHVFEIEQDVSSKIFTLLEFTQIYSSLMKLIFFFPKASQER